jgi:hypothetical protein
LVDVNQHIRVLVANMLRTKWGGAVQYVGNMLEGPRKRPTVLKKIADVAVKRIRSKG